jgi:hypothetical protein
MGVNALHITPTGHAPSPTHGQILGQESPSGSESPMSCYVNVKFFCVCQKGLQNGRCPQVEHIRPHKTGQEYIPCIGVPRGVASDHYLT